VKITTSNDERNGFGHFSSSDSYLLIYDNLT